MFSIDDTLSDLNVKERTFFKVLYSMNSPAIAMPGYASEEARCYILFFSEGSNLSSYIGLYLPRVDTKYFYSYASNPFPFEAESDVEEEARAFAEEMGFLLDEVNVSGMAVADRNSWIEEQFIFGYRSPENEESVQLSESVEESVPGEAETPVVAATAEDLPEIPAKPEITPEEQTEHAPALPAHAASPTSEGKPGSPAKLDIFPDEQSGDAPAVEKLASAPAAEEDVSPETPAKLDIFPDNRSGDSPTVEELAPAPAAEAEVPPEAPAKLEVFSNDKTAHPEAPSRPPSESQPDAPPVLQEDEESSSPALPPERQADSTQSPAPQLGQRHDQSMAEEVLSQSEMKPPTETVAELPKQKTMRKAPVVAPRAPVRKKTPPAAKARPAAAVAVEEEIPVSLEYVPQKQPPRSPFGEALPESAVKPPKLDRGRPHSPTGVVTRDKEALARLLASF